MSDKTVRQIKVSNLFGLYTYTLPSQADLPNAAILYGDNGVGKSTVLRMAFHMLSASHNKGHRFALYETKFDNFQINLASGHILKSEFRTEGTVKILVLTIELEDEVLYGWEYVPNKHRSELDNLRKTLVLTSAGRTIRIRPPSVSKARSVKCVWGENEYLAALASLTPITYILNADRRLDCDAVANPGDEIELRKLMHYEEPKSISDLVSRSRQIALSQALAIASKWLSRRALQSANEGTENVHTVYAQVLKQLISTHSDMMEADVSNSELVAKMVSVEHRSLEYAKYELTAPLSIAEFKKALTTRKQEKRALSANLLSPYIDSLDSRLKALQPIYDLINRFVLTINELLSDKSIVYKLTQGFKFVNRHGEPLDPSVLSSGEQQLLLLFCNVLVARDHSTLFMIDEPEISLNVKWQRQLIRVLLELVNETKVQFIFASHSIELLSQHRNKVVKLENENEN